MCNGGTIHFNKVAYETPCLLAIFTNTLTSDDVVTVFHEDELKALKTTDKIRRVISEHENKDVLYLFIHASGGLYSNRPPIEYFRDHAHYTVLEEDEFFNNCKAYGIPVDNLRMRLNYMSGTDPFLTRVHRLKFKGIELCDAVCSGQKTHEIRWNDRNYKTGDIIEPIAMSDNLIPIDHPINKKRYCIGHVSTGTGIVDGYCVFSIHEIK